MEVLFKAFDGKIFTDEDECRDYELELEYKNVDKDIVLLDAHGGVMLDSIQNVDLDRIFTIVVKSPAAADFLNNLFDEAGIYTPDGGFSAYTAFWWDDEKNKWIDVSVKIGKLKDEIVFFQEKLNLLSNF